MTLAVRLDAPRRWLDVVEDYVGYVTPLARRVRRRRHLPAMLALKTIEWAVYRWHQPALVRSYEAQEVWQLLFQITSRCTDRCEKCGIWRRPEAVTDRVELHQVERSLEALAGRLGSFTVTGGEPLLYKEDVLRLARRAEELRVPMTVVSNATLADADFVREFGALGHTLVVSIDTLDVERWRRFRGRDNRSTVLANVERAIQALGPRLKVQSVLAAETVSDVEGVAAWCRSVRICHAVQPWMDFGGGWTPAPAGRPGRGSRCEAWRNVCIYPNGDVVRCFDHERLEVARAPLGNLKRDRIEDLLETPRAHEVTAAMRTCHLPCSQLSCNRAGA